MATTGFWPIKGELRTAIEYAENPDKTMDTQYLDADLHAALQYAQNEVKTDRKLYVSGINCSRRFACEEMMAVKRRFGERGRNVAYHGYQSFAKGEVTPEEAHRIGVETARKMWGERFQVVVATHLNTDNLHNHFVVNSVSFKDGKKFRNKIGQHMELRRISDEVCARYEKQVLVESEFYSGDKRSYWAHQNGLKTHRDHLREDVEYCLSVSATFAEFETQLCSMGYALDKARFSVKAAGWQRAVRLDRLSFSKEEISRQLMQNREEGKSRTIRWRRRQPYRPKTFPLEREMRRLEFSIENSYDTAVVMVDVLLLLLIAVLQAGSLVRDELLLSPDLRAEVRNIERFLSDSHFLEENHIRTMPELEDYLCKKEREIAALEQERKKLKNHIRRPKSTETLMADKEFSREISKKLKPLRRQLKKAEEIRQKAPELYQLLQTELILERRSYMKNRGYER